MRLPFCDHHISAFLQTQSKKPLDQALSAYFKAHKSIGAHDRRTIGETLYGMTRWKTLIDSLCPTDHPIDRIQCYRKLDLVACQSDSSLPEWVRYGLPEFLYRKLGKELALLLNQQAPTTIRVNTLKISREDLLQRWEGKFELKPTAKALHGIQFLKRYPLFSLPEFKDGLFEVQDEGSQIVAALVAPKPGEHVLDYCSGSGGKTLAFAPAMKGKGQIYLYDNRPWILLEARKRLKRAGIQNVQFTLPQKKVDWLLADVPCSGTGTLRRNPDAKWNIDAAMVDRLILQQREIVAKALPHLKVGGHFVYATCSILPEENEEQMEFFMREHSLELVEKLSLLPEENGHDGFFAAVFKKTIG
jgi:16S rRNA C967 or C1407 C5-methylase (RsmB/RsmF family)